jgi:hypothetical protein
MLYEAFLNEAETATEKRSPSYDNGHGEITQVASKDDRTPIERDSRDHKKGSITFRGDVDEKGNKHFDQHSENRDKYNAAKKYANKELKPGFFKKADPEKVSQAADAISRHDRRHPDRKLTESFDVSVFE